MTAASTIAEIQLRMQTVDQTLAEKHERAEALEQSDADFTKMLADSQERIQALSNAVKVMNCGSIPAGNALKRPNSRVKSSI